jgi:hypothetical protein
MTRVSPLHPCIWGAHGTSPLFLIVQNYVLMSFLFLMLAPGDPLKLKTCALHFCKLSSLTILQFLSLLRPLYLGLPLDISTSRIDLLSSYLYFYISGLFILLFHTVGSFLINHTCA